MQSTCDLVRDVLDNQLVDSQGYPMGKVDGIVLEVEREGPPRVVGIEVGVTVLARRLNRGLGRRVATWSHRSGPRRGGLFRLPWARIRAIGRTVQLDIRAGETPAPGWERWVRDNVLKRIPGGQ